MDNTTLSNRVVTHTVWGSIERFNSVRIVVGRSRISAIC